jgi:hypothetical protein
MNQYSAKNQALILTQCPHATDVRSMGNWNKAGFRIVKGSKAIRIFGPARRGVSTTEGDDGKLLETVRTYKMVNVFDISQVEPAPQNTGKQARRVAATIQQAAQDAEYDLYCDNIAGMDTPPSFDEWQRVQQEAALMWDESLNAYDVTLAAD